jgi:hypothetical protein
VGIREKINENKNLAAGITIGLIVIALILIFVQANADNPANEQGEVYLTSDDGATFVEGAADKIPPLNEDGKVTYGARVYECEDGKRFVGAVERYLPEAKAKLEEYFSKKPEERDATIPQKYDTDRFKEIKKPGTGDTGWVAVNSSAGRQLLQVPCQSGSGTAVEVKPGQ